MCNFNYLHSRFSKCTLKTDPRGRSLSRFIEDNCYIMLNGRCKSDAQGNTTYDFNYSNGTKGYSTVDYAMATINSYLYDLKIEDGFNNVVGHSALSISLYQSGNDNAQ